MIGQRQRDVDVAPQRSDMPFVQIRYKGHIAHIDRVDRATVASGQLEIGDFGGSRQGATVRQWDLRTAVAQKTGWCGRIGALHWPQAADA
ncbi:hypothetical protein [Ruegeria denitrificans]|uniref:hypothetical protein n=1 Tax=Ruegeria denitrificans TaxID=1715692 RepID=UPI003C7D2611